MEKLTDIEDFIAILLEGYLSAIEVLLLEISCVGPIIKCTTDLARPVIS
jgi:hypothetical protein